MPSAPTLDASSSHALGRGLLEEGYRRTDRIMAWLLLAHLPLILALAPLHDSWGEVLVWGLPCIGIGVGAVWRWPGVLFTRLAMASASLANTAYGRFGSINGVSRVVSWGNGAVSSSAWAALRRARSPIN